MHFFGFCTSRNLFFQTEEEYTMNNYQITQWCARFIREQVKPGDICIDATMGKRKRYPASKHPCRQRRKSPRLRYSGKRAAPHRRKAAQRRRPRRTGHCFLESHAHMSRYAEPGSVSCIVFNLGYLPGGDHSMATRSDSTIRRLNRDFCF